MNDLITVTYSNERPTVLGRDLHEKLEIDTPYRIWFPRMCEYGFTEGVDFNPYKNVRVQKEGNREVSREIEDHQLTLDMAKQICMIQRSDAGKRYREYFLEVERKWNDPQAVMARSLIYANRQLDAAKVQLAEANALLEAAKPKVIFADAVAASKTSILVGELAKILRQNGVRDMGQKRLFGWLRDNGYLMKTGSSYNMPTQKSMERGLFEIKEGSVTNADGSIRVTKTPKITGRGQTFFINLFLSREQEETACT